jgi:peptidoglycan/LPS O-acetylase OafA/YrhL
MPPRLVAPIRFRWRFAVALAALVAAVAHVPVIGEHLEEAPYMGVLFLLLTIACTVLAIGMLVRDAPPVYAAAASVCALAVLGYAATRIVAFPQLDDDVGNWLEPLGVVSVLSECCVVAGALMALRSSAGRAPAPARA